METEIKPELMGNLFITGENGEMIPFVHAADMDIKQVKPDPDEGTPIIKRPVDAEATMTIRFRPFFLKRVTRKRFIKQMMAMGMYRNNAQILAEIVRWNKDSYSFALWQIGTGME